MSKIIQTSSNVLSGREREFFSLLRNLIIANPFSDERIKNELIVSGLSKNSDSEEILNKTISKVEQRINRLERDNYISIDYFNNKDRDLINKGIIFLFFYKFRAKFDQLIIDQIKADDKAVKVPFANEAISFLSKRGYTIEKINHYIALSYQLRRAFFFITKNLKGRTSAIKKLRFNLWNNVFTHNLDLYDRYLWNRMEDFTTLILGETGSGKDTAAIAIGRSGFIPFDNNKESFVESFTHSFVSLNLSQFPETLIESELFGHKKGAFTGATENFKGIFERCSPYGSILLDEIGEISPPVQIKLLQVLQDRVFCPVGSHKKSRFQGRIIAATNRSLEEIRSKGIFRDDFYYRLCSAVITVPTLRERIQEDPHELDDLIDHTVERMVGKASPELGNMVREVIEKQLGKEYPWYGNVRELEQCVRRVLLYRHYEPDIKPVYTDMDSDLQSFLIHGIEAGHLNAQTLLGAYCKLLYQRSGTYEKVAAILNLDSRTVKKHIKILDSPFIHS